MPKTISRRRRFIRKRGRKLTKTQVRQVKKIVVKEAETKYFIAGPASFNVADAQWLLEPILLMPQGVADIERTGDAINIKSIEFRYSVTLPINSDSTVYSRALIRVALVQWHPNNSAAPAGYPPAGPLLLTEDPSNLLTPYCPHNHDGAGQYTYLYDKVHLLTKADALGGDMQGSAHFRSLVFHKRFRRHIQFSAASTNCQNCIYVFVTTSAPVTGNPVDLPSIQYQARINYTDS